MIGIDPRGDSGGDDGGRDDDGTSSASNSIKSSASGNQEESVCGEEVSSSGFDSTEGAKYSLGESDNSVVCAFSIWRWIVVTFEGAGSETVRVVRGKGVGTLEKVGTDFRPCSVEGVVLFEDRGSLLQRPRSAEMRKKVLR